jgi:hypothetical protein
VALEARFEELDAAHTDHLEDYKVSVATFASNMAAMRSHCHTHTHTLAHIHTPSHAHACIPKVYHSFSLAFCG